MMIFDPVYDRTKRESKKNHEHCMIIYTYVTSSDEVKIENRVLDVIKDMESKQ